MEHIRSFPITSLTDVNFKQDLQQTDYSKMSTSDVNQNSLKVETTDELRPLYGQTYDGINYPIFLPCEPHEHLNNVKNLAYQEDDTLVCSYPKSGTHWVLEIVSMLKRRKATPTAAYNFLDIIPAKAMEGVPNPRVFASHFRFKHLPEELLRNRSKVIYVLRNPKDIAVSLFTFCKGNRDMAYNGTWEEFFNSFLNGEVSYSSWFSHVRSWEEAREENRKYPILFVFYEDLQKDPESEIRRIAEFLDTKTDESLIQAIVDKTRLEHMRSHQTRYFLVPVEYMDPNHNSNLFRKGEVGDWKHHFSKQQLEQFDKEYEEKMKGSNLKFKYQLLS